MNKLKYFVILSVALFLMSGCSDEAKDEAAQLEMELSGDSTAILDSLAEEQRVADSIIAAEEIAAEPVAVEEPPTAMPAKPAGEGYTVQVAGCEDRDYAHYLVGKYTERGYEPFVTSITIEGQGFYRVRIGIFASLSDAKALETELKDKYSVDAWIDVTVNNY